MKKTIYILLIISCFNISFGQQGKFISAVNYLEVKDILNAKTAIDEASKHEKTIGKSKTWLYKGLIYHAISDSCIGSNNESYCNLEKDFLDITFDSYLKALVLNIKDTSFHKINLNNSKDLETYKEIISNSKTKYFSKENNRIIIKDKLPFIKQLLAYYGYSKYDKNGDYENAVRYYKKSLLASELSGIIDTSIIAYTAYAYNKQKDYKNAIPLFKELTSKYNYGKDTKEKTSLYIILADMQLIAGDSSSFINTLDEAIKKFPKENLLLIKEIEYYIASNNIIEAKNKIQKALEKDPNNDKYLMSMGIINIKSEDYIEAVNVLEKAVKINPEDSDIHYYLGIAYFNTGVVIYRNLDNIKDNKQHQEEKNKAIDYYNLAAKQLEEANKITPNDFETINSLKKIYARLGNKEKHDEYLRILESLK